MADARLFTPSPNQIADFVVAIPYPQPIDTFEQLVNKPGAEKDFILATASGAKFSIDLQLSAKSTVNFRVSFREEWQSYSAVINEFKRQMDKLSSILKQGQRDSYLDVFERHLIRQGVLPDFVASFPYTSLCLDIEKAVAREITVFDEETRKSFSYSVYEDVKNFQIGKVREMRIALDLERGVEGQHKIKLLVTSVESAIKKLNSNPSMSSDERAALDIEIARARDDSVAEFSRVIAIFKGAPLQSRERDQLVSDFRTHLKRYGMAGEQNNRLHSAPSYSNHNAAF